MKFRTLLAALVAFVAAPSVLADPPFFRIPLTGSTTDFNDACRAGKVRGGGYDASDQTYAWTCGNYNWSAEMGGGEILSGGDGSTISDYDAPTTTGGNSWQTVCSGDGNGTPDTVEETPCLHAGEILNNYATADIMLAADNTRPGGNIYLPRGLYVIAGMCGQQSNGDPNGCPVLKATPGSPIRQLGMWGGRELIGEGQDPDGPHENGRTGTWLILATGDDLDGDGSLFDDIKDRNGDGWGNNHNGGVRIGGTIGGNTCKRDDGTGGCAVTIPSSGGDVVSLGTFGRSFTDAILNEDIDISTGHPRVCLSNDILTTGSCSGNRYMQCTTVADERTGLTSGGCVLDDSGIGGGSVDFGDCEPLVEALQTEMEAHEAIDSLNPAPMYFVMDTDTPDHRGVGSVSTGTGKQKALARIGAFDSSGNITGAVLETCQTTGKWVYISESLDVNSRFGISHMPIWDASLHPTTIEIPEWGKFNNDGGGISHLNIMAAHWLGRNSPNNAADCNAFQGGGVQDDGQPNSACDSNGYLHMGSGWGGGANYISTWYGGGRTDAFAFSMVDGNAAGLGVELGHSQLNWGYGLATDMSAWFFHDNTWRDWDINGTFFVTAYAPGAYVERDRFINIAANYGFALNGNPSFFMRDSRIESSHFVVTMFDLRGTRKALFSNISGFGNRGNVWLVSPSAVHDIWDVIVENVNFQGHANYQSGSSPRPTGLISVWDDDGSAGLVGGEATNILFRNHHYTVSADTNLCAIWLGGGLGHEGADTHGLGRTVDDFRHLLSFENIYVERVAVDTITGDFEFFCLGNANSSENSPSQSFGTIWDSRGGMPRFVNLCVDGQCLADNPYRSQRVADAVLDGNDDVDDVNEIITFTDHGLRDSDAVTYDEIALGGTGGLVDDTVYYVRYSTKDALLLYPTRALEDNDYCTANEVPYQCCTGASAGTCAGPMDLTDDADGTFSLTTGFEPDCDDLSQGTIIRTHSATSEGDCTDADADGLLDGGGDYNALCQCSL
jgi:hypothetical protein